METIKVNTSQHVEIDYPIAGLGERIAARLIDLALFFGLYILIIFSGLLTVSFKSPTIFYVLIGIFVVIYVFYNLVCEIFMNGQCIGKKMMKIKVISLDGGQASIGQYFIRWVFRLVDFVLTGQVGGLICIALSEKKQRIGDIVAGTTVIKTVPPTKIEHIAFRPFTEADYVPLITNVAELSDRDVELIHEVLNTYYQTYNHDLIYTMSAKVAAHLGISKLPEGINELDFLRVVVKDYNHITANAE
jgi:uncharacterized RDD family membrane protein YckC